MNKKIYAYTDTVRDRTDLLLERLFAVLHTDELLALLQDIECEHNAGKISEEEQHLMSCYCYVVLGYDEKASSLAQEKLALDDYPALKFALLSLDVSGIKDRADLMPRVWGRYCESLYYLNEANPFMTKNAEIMLQPREPDLMQAHEDYIERSYFILDHFLAFYHDRPDSVWFLPAARYMLKEFAWKFSSEDIEKITARMCSAGLRTRSREASVQDRFRRYN